MLNRRAFVQSLGIGTVGTLSLLETPAAAAAAGCKTRRGAPPCPPTRSGSAATRIPTGRRPAAIAAAKSAALEGHRYAGAVSSKLIESIATAHGVPPSEIMLSGGSGDLLRAAVRAFTAKDLSLVTGSPSYEQPVRLAQQAKVPVHEVPLTGDLKLDLDAMLAKARGSGLVYICNPNNPTSTIVPSADVKRLIEQVAKSSPATTVLVDEAYFEYADDPGVCDADPARRRVSVSW